MKCMKTLLTVLSLLALAACAAPPKPQVAQKPVNDQYAGNGFCGAEADRKLRLFDRPDTYPISDQEKPMRARRCMMNA